MSLNHASLHVALDGDRTETIENIVVELQDDIRHGRVTDDVSRLLAQRLEAAGVDMPPDAIDDLAEAIENDVSLLPSADRGRRGLSPSRGTPR